MDWRGDLAEDLAEDLAKDEEAFPGVEDGFVPLLPHQPVTGLGDEPGYAAADNIADHLPDEERAWVDAKLVEAFGHPDPDQGLHNPKQLAAQLG